MWEIPALSLHEAVPGHHHQISLAQELELAPFRRNFTSFTAFTEGWGLYAESLGAEMGIYDTPAKRMGQLSYQAWRASRLVVDTGIHAKGWDKARAVAFMKENTALTDANIRCGGQSLHQLARPGSGLHDRQHPHPRAPREGGAGTWSEVRYSPIPRCGAAPGIGAVSTCCRRRSINGSRRKKAARSGFGCVL
jgi:hypothetical protein